MLKAQRSAADVRDAKNGTLTLKQAQKVELAYKRLHG
jgi:hypothetical protein